VVPLEGFRYSLTQGLKTTYDGPAKKLWKGVLYRAHIGDVPTEIKGTKDILWYPRFSKEFFCNEYDSYKELGKADAYMQEFLNKPIDESLAVFRKSDFVAATDEELEAIQTGRKPLLYYIGVDLAITLEKKADYTVFHVVGIDSEGMMYHIDTIRDRLDGKQIVDMMFAIQNRYNPQWFAVEKEQIARTLHAYIQERMLQSGTFINFVPDLTAHSDKRARASSILGRFRAKGIRFNKKADYYPVLESEFLVFDRGKHDDQVDAYSCIGLGLNKMNKALTYEQIEEDNIQDEERTALIGHDGRSPYSGY
jgi:predicted phage terminase large subunit-like protein